MSGRERRGVPPLRLIEIMAAAADVEDGGAPTSTPLEPSMKLSVVDSPGDDLGKAKMEAYPYRRVIGKLMYLAVCKETRHQPGSK